MTDTDAREDRANGTALGNKVGQPIVDTRMMLVFDRTDIRLHAPLGGRVGADRCSASED
jgi:hypothetical protein